MCGLGFFGLLAVVAMITPVDVWMSVSDLLWASHPCIHDAGAEQTTSFSGRGAGATAYSHPGSRFVGTFPRARVAGPALDQQREFGHRDTPLGQWLAVFGLLFWCLALDAQ